MKEFIDKLIAKLEQESKVVTTPIIEIECLKLSDAIDAVKSVAEECKNQFCEHKWIFRETQQKTTVSGYEHYTANYHRIDVYFCEKCCEIKKIEQQESVGLPFGGIRNLHKFAPIWYQQKGE